MNQSRKHHFLPEFYLKGFANQIGQFSIFNVKSNKPKQKGKLFYPSSHFYEINSNTIKFENNESDFIEKLYIGIENRFAKILSLIINGNSKNRFNVTEEEMPLINNFASHIYWRNPANEKELKTYISKYSLNQLGMKILDKEGNYDVELSEKFKKETEFYKAYKLYTALLDSIRGFNCRTQYHIFPKSNEYPVILSDNPIIYQNTNNIKVYEDDYIFPLSKSRTFIKRNLKNKFDPHLHFLIDLIQLKQSKNYFAYTDINYVEFLQDLDLQNKLTIDEYKSILFKSLE